VITAETITDEQIRELYRAVCIDDTVKLTASDEIAVIRAATSIGEYRTPEVMAKYIHPARARVAEILNARAKESK
jgi:hypothetical protein